PHHSPSRPESETPSSPVTSTTSTLFFSESLLRDEAGQVLDALQTEVVALNERIQIMRREMEDREKRKIVEKRSWRGLLKVRIFFILKKKNTQKNAKKMPMSIYIYIWIENTWWKGCAQSLMSEL